MTCHKLLQASVFLVFAGTALGGPGYVSLPMKRATAGVGSTSVTNYQQAGYTINGMLSPTHPK